MTDVEHLFMFVSHLYVFFGEMSVWFFGPFFDWVIFFFFLELSCLYIFEINSLSVALFAIIFSHSGGCLFTLFVVSFVVQKLLSCVKKFIQHQAGLLEGKLLN